MQHTIFAKNSLIFCSFSSNFNCSTSPLSPCYLNSVKMPRIACDFSRADYSNITAKIVGVSPCLNLISLSKWYFMARNGQILYLTIPSWYYYSLHHNVTVDQLYMSPECSFLLLYFLANECVRLQPIINGNATCLSGRTDDTCTFECNAGFSLQGSQSRTCQPDQSWSGVTPACKSKYCSTWWVCIVDNLLT